MGRSLSDIVRCCPRHRVALSSENELEQFLHFFFLSKGEKTLFSHEQRKCKLVKHLGRSFSVYLSRLAQLLQSITQMWIRPLLCRPEETSKNKRMRELGEPRDISLHLPGTLSSYVSSSLYSALYFLTYRPDSRPSTWTVTSAPQRTLTQPHSHALAPLTWQMIQSHPVF